jgi:pyruvate dehydrogenase E2 component (dihydrolipoamide acetyltransferase)
MATELRMPDMGTVEGTVTLVRWLKPEGASVALGEPLFEVETDKGVSEVEAALAGVLVKQLIAEGAKAGSGEPIALIQRPGESEGAGAARAASSIPAAEHVAPPAAGPTLRALAEKWGVDLAQVRATGPRGRITREDILHARDGGVVSDPQAPRPGLDPGALAAPVTPGHASAPISAGLALSHAQGIVARKVSRSHREKPVYRVNALVDMSKAIAYREQSKAGGGAATSWDAMLVKAAATALVEMPLFRRWMSGDTVAEHSSADVAVAVSVGDDLFMPAVRSPAGKGVSAISREIESLAKKAEARTLTPADIEESCFLVSNLGMFPIESFDAVIYPDHSAALAVGAVTPTPVSDGAKIWIAPMVRLSLAVDHRLINGRAAARFLTRVRQIMEEGTFA